MRPMLLDAHESQLVLVDYQPRLMPAIFEGPLVMANAMRLARMAQLMEVPLWATEQNPEKLGTNPDELAALVEQCGGATVCRSRQSRRSTGK